MHGILFASLHDFLRERGGRSAVDEVFEHCSYSMFEAHPDEDFAALLERASAWGGDDGDTLLHDLGVYTGEKTFPRLYPAFYELAGDSRTFLLGVETRIHELVRATIPDARPPELTIRSREHGSLEIDYRSSRRLCSLLAGLVDGTARHYGEELQVEETACRRDGATACRFLVSPHEARKGNSAPSASASASRSDASL